MEEPKHRTDKANKKEQSTKQPKMPTNQDTEKPTSSNSRNSQGEQVVLVNDDDDGDLNLTNVVDKVATNKKEENNILNHIDDDIQKATMSKSDAIHSFIKNKASNQNSAKTTKEMNTRKKANQNTSSATSSKKKIEITDRKEPLQEKKKSKQTRPVERRLKRPEPYTGPVTVSDAKTHLPALRKPLVNTGKDNTSNISSNDKVSNIQQKITDEEYNDLIAGDDDNDSDSCSSLIEF